MSFSGCWSSIAAADRVPLANRTWIWLPSSTTCRAVSTEPSALITTPAPSDDSVSPDLPPASTVTRDGAMRW